MDTILEKFRAIQWRYAPQDPVARAELGRRIAEAGRREQLIPYSDLVRNITFVLPSLREPEHRIDTAEWEDIDRTIIGDFLGYLSMESYEIGGFFASALVVSKETRLPGEGYFNLLKELGLLKSSKTDKAAYLWADHVRKAQEWYRTHKDA